MVVKFMVMNHPMIQSFKKNHQLNTSKGNFIETSKLSSSKPEKQTKKSVGKKTFTDVFRRSFGVHQLNLRDPALLVARNQVPTFADWEMMGP